ncbi:MAG TPA: 23S rRNA (pseudouridine(1915)-N(3))-methyltransferase RlmH [Thermoanaerobaculia bacterium]|nr:23S rRNA (pseudouridine(1915)-N(3))-methyltransferase RlmH [Thermoanaerobaculia bacterium]
MSRELLILWVGRHDREPWRGLCADYRKRIARLAPVRDRQIRVRVDGGRRLEAERDAILTALPDPVWLVALDVQGEARDSVAFSRWLSGIQTEWPHPLAFVVGSDAGLHGDVVARSRSRVSFGPMTLAHELARLVLYEQLYRALAIDRGIQYHRAPF